MKHLSNDDIIAAAEGDTSHTTHVESCEICGARVRELGDVLRLTREVDVPEPSPLFWNHFSDRVRESIAAEPEVRRPAWGRFGLAWPAGVLGALAVALVAVVVTGRQMRAPADSSATTTASAVALSDSDLMATAMQPPSLVDDASWALMNDLASDLDWDDAGVAGLVAQPGSAERALNSLSEAQRQAVVDALREELAAQVPNSL